MLDCDARPDGPKLSWQQIDQVIGEIVPGWKDTLRLWRPSSSAFVYRTSDGWELIGQGSWRGYVMVDDASATPLVGAFIYRQLWEQGHGYILVSKSGQALDRSLVDASVWQPERIDFAAEPVLGEGLIRRAPNSVLIGTAPLLSTNGIKSELTLREWRQSSEVLKKAKDKKAFEVSAVRKAFIAEQANSVTARKLNIPERHLKSLWRRAVERKSPNQRLHLAPGRRKHGDGRRGPGRS